jgi:hypothetical protein
VCVHAPEIQNLQKIPGSAEKGWDRTLSRDVRIVYIGMVYEGRLLHQVQLTAGLCATGLLNDHDIPG